MKYLPFALLLALFAVSGCESTPHYDRTKTVTVGPAYPKKPYGSVKLFQDKSEVPGTYDVIEIMSVEGKAGDEAAFIKAFLYHGADVGADGVILYRAGVVGGSEGMGFGGKSGFGMSQSLTQDAVFRGEAIHFHTPN